MFTKDITILFIRLIHLSLGLKIFNIHFFQIYQEPDINLEITSNYFHNLHIVCIAYINSDSTPMKQLLSKIKNNSSIF